MSSYQPTEWIDHVTDADAAHMNKIEAQLVSLSHMFNVKDYGAKGNGVTDDQPAIQAALNALKAAGGGTLFLPPGTYLLTTANNVGGVKWHLSVAADNVTITGPGTLKTNTADAYILWVGGWLKADNLNWHLHSYVGYGAGGEPTLYTINPAAKGAMSITMSTPANANNFAPGDRILIRTGQTFTFNSLNTEPDAEINEVRAVNGSTGVIDLKYPLTKPYAQEYFISGTYGKTSTAVTANPALFGVAKVTDRTSVNVVLDGFRMETAGAHAITGSGIDGFTVKNLRVTGGPMLSMGNYRNGSIRNNYNAFSSATDNYGITTATCTTDVLIEGNELSNAQGVNYIHVHEGGARIQIRGNRILGKASAGGLGSIDIRSRAYDVLVQDNIFVNGYIGVYVDVDCVGGGRIEGNRFYGTFTNPNSIAVDPPGWSIANNDSAGPYVTAPDIGSNAEEVIIPIGAMAAAIGATLGLVSPQNYQAITLADGAVQAGIASLQVPQHWQGYDVYLMWTNLGAGSGNVAMGLQASDIADAESINVGPESNTGPSAIPSAPAQYVIKTTKMNSVTIPCGRSSLQWIQIYRLGADGTDTLAASVALLGVRLRRAR